MSRSLNGSRRPTSVGGMFLRWRAQRPRSGWPLARRLPKSQPAAAATAATQPQTKPTVVLDRPVKGVLLIGIDRIDAQNCIDIPTFSAIGQAYYQFEHDDDLKVAVLHGKGPDFSQGLDQASWGAALRNGPFQTPQNFIDPVATAGPERSKPLVVAVQGHVTRVAHELFLAADLRIAAQDAIFNQGEVTAASFPGAGLPCASSARPAGATRCATC